MPPAPRTLRGLGLTVLAPLVGCAVTEPGIEIDVRPQVEVATFDAAGTPTSGRDLAEEVYGLGPHGGRKVNASIELGSAAHAPIMPAPGAYVLN